jgi:hypothetical protein
MENDKIHKEEGVEDDQAIYMEEKRKIKTSR